MISFIIVNYRTADFLPRCIGSIKKHLNEVGHEIIIVNNDQIELSQAGFMNDVTIINNGSNLGFAAACNKGSRKAKGKYLFFLNPDTELFSGGLVSMLDYLQRNAALGAVSPELVSTDGMPEKWSYGKDPNLWLLVKNNFHFKRDIHVRDKKEPFLVDWASGASFLIKRDVFENVGGFDEGFFMYFEDVDLCRKIRQKGLSIAIFPSFKVMHVGGASFDSKNKQKTLYFRSQDRFFLKNHGFFALLLLKILRFFHK